MLRQTISQNTNTNKAGLMSGGLMKGLMLGGLAGFLIWKSICQHGSIRFNIGLLVNVLAIVVIIVVIRKIFVILQG